MAMTLNSRITGKITGTAVKDGTEFEDVQYTLSFSADVSLADGVAANQADQEWHDEGSLLADGTTTYDVAGGITDEFGAAVTFARIKAIYFKNTSTTASVLRLGGGTGGDGTNAFDTWVTSTAADGSEGVLVRAGGFILLCAPDATAYVVTGGTIDILLIEEMSTLAATYELCLIGSLT